MEDKGPISAELSHKQAEFEDDVISRSQELHRPRLDGVVRS